MLTLLVIDPTRCEKDLQAFIKKHKGAVKAMYTNETVVRATAGSVTDAAGIRKKLVINSSDALSVLTINDIIHCESQRNYTLLHLTGDRQIMVSKTLMDFETLLSVNGFARIHKSHLVNLHYLEKFIKAEGGYVVLTNGKRLPVAVRKKELLFKEIEKL